MRTCIVFLASMMLFACGGDNSSSSNSTSSTISSSGQGGSTATFAIAANNLYVMDTVAVRGFSLQQAESPLKFQDYALTSTDGETLINHQNTHLFVGKSRGVDILQIDDEGLVQLVATHDHMTACDPVVTQENRAFITTRSGIGCGIGDNLLEVLDITDINNPVVIYSQQLSAPKGLAVFNENLFVCDDEDGLLRFTINDTDNEVFSIEPAYVSDVFLCDDLIVQDGQHLILRNSEGIIQILWEGDQFTLLSELLVE